jgi:hypothetical protein
MIRISLRELYMARDVLRKLAQMDFSLRTGYSVSKIAKAADSELLPAEAKKNELIRKYGEQDKFNGEFWHVKPESEAEVNQQFQQMLDVDVDLNCNPIKISMLDGERLPTHDRLLAILMEVREQKRAPLDAIPEIRGLTVRLSPLEVMRIEKFIDPD